VTTGGEREQICNERQPHCNRCRTSDVWHGRGAENPVSLRQCGTRSDAACTAGHTAQAHQGARATAITDTAGEQLRPSPSGAS
jgi:hypothetical protein